MESAGWTGGLFRMCEWITRLAFVNGLWLLFTVVGLGLFGFAPATVAMFSIVRKWIMGEQSFSVYSTFWTIYKKEFRKANLLFGLVLLTLVVLYVNYVIIHAMTGALYYVLLICFSLFCLVVAVVLLYIFPIYVHFEGSLLHYFRSAILVGTSFPLRTVVMAVTAFTAVLLGLLLPGVALLFFGSGLSFALMFISYSIFSTIQPATGSTTLT
ncbi:DUF624 domain-containing protein [Halalkalibacterium halodurans]|uniref:YesL family protein n=1 Tax=Halalkalibacterium halodurans TaxID=86665 RepID=UPI0006A99297|nr:DUF624 domain-containing protein [Halalkalibacterium halodurans]MDY7221484.1 DUF624 domain-containing protein [Halalkalibacterium halodurans]MDY7240760.1 DUF624 domain-containing protein [Halalkalibacterium halodurans]MED3647396.1 DUF624 domain-containing protein [Halalkalibacterium halodurans]MED4080718.1 DUF624 domain-containing protein [Halalkalibacterium halodurans]MED4085859.1 DUF624 domain-containing protein [Halalkalibacterium halodurans]